MAKKGGSSTTHRYILYALIILTLVIFVLYAILMKYSQGFRSWQLAAFTAGGAEGEGT